MINGVDVTNPNQNFTWTEWNKLHRNYNYIFERRNPTHGRNNDQGEGKGQAREHNQMTKGLPACSIQALQQASSILSKITGSMYAAQGENEEETPSNTGNSFGGASYGG